MGVTRSDAADARRRRRSVAIAGHSGDVSVASAALDDPDPAVRSTALGALERLNALDDSAVTTSLSDEDVAVRRRAAEVAATHPDVDLAPALHDVDARVVEVAAWACGEHESDRAEIVERLIVLATEHDEPLVRESAVAALGAIGDPRGFDAIVGGAADKPAVRRRAVLALAPFIDDDDLGERTESAITHALEDRDWQVRQAAEDLRHITSE